MQSIDTVLDQVRGRLSQARGIRFLSFGVVAGSAGSAILALLYAAGAPVWLGWCLVCPLLAGVVAGVLGRCLPTRKIAAAAVIDRNYQLKDRAVTALDFERREADGLRQMQLLDAAAHLRDVDPARCVPFHLDRRLVASSGVFGCVALAAIVYAHWMHKDVVARASLPIAVEQASYLRETMLPEIETLKESDDPEIEELAEELEQLVEQLEEESIDPEDLMATLSEMEASLAEARASLELEATDAQLQNIAAAMAPAESMQAAAHMMQSEEYEAASEQLEQIDPKQLSDKERRAVADNLKKTLAKLAAGKKGELSNAAQLLKDGLEEQDPSQCKDGLCKIGALCKRQARKKKIGQCLACQLNRLSNCKEQCRSRTISDKLDVSKSTKPSQSAGRGASGEPQGKTATRLDGDRQQEQLDSQHGEGPSESEILTAAEGEQEAKRQYAARYQEFRRRAEAVLETEPLPLGHRETVRHYFESIRPNTEEDTAVQREPMP